MQNELSRQNRRVLKAFKDGKTIYEVHENLKGRPGIRQLRTIIKSLINSGYLEDLDDGRYGPKCHKYIMVSDFLRQTKPRKIDGATDNDQEILSNIYRMAIAAITAIQASSRSRNRTHIREICNQHIRPVVKEIIAYENQITPEGLRIIHLRKLPHPGEFFTDEARYASEFRPISSKDRKGTIQIRHPKSSDPNDSFYPSLEDWLNYLGYISVSLAKFHFAHLMDLQDQRDS